MNQNFTREEWIYMQLDRKSLNQMLRMDDKQLRQLINRLAGEAGIDRASLNISDSRPSALRKALGLRFRQRAD